MARTLFFQMVLKNFSVITNNKQIFSQCKIFYNCEYFFFQSAFWSLLNHWQRSQSDQEQCSLCCSSPCYRAHYGPLQYFSTFFRKLKQVWVLRPIFPDYVISCGYFFNKWFPECFLHDMWLKKSPYWFFSIKYLIIEIGYQYFEEKLTDTRLFWISHYTVLSYQVSSRTNECNRF